jgi:hypothetical protein
VTRTPQEFEPDNLDALLRRALQDRPTPSAAADLVSRAMELAKESHSSTLAMASRVSRLNRLVTAIAAVMIICISGWVFRARLSAGGFQPWSDTATSSYDSTSTSSADSSSNTGEWMFVGIALTVAAVGILAVQRTIGATDEWMLRWNARSLS